MSYYYNICGVLIKVNVLVKQSLNVSKLAAALLENTSVYIFSVSKLYSAFLHILSKYVVL